MCSSTHTKMVLLVKVAFEDDAILSFEDNYEVIYE